MSSNECGFFQAYPQVLIQSLSIQREKNPERMRNNFGRGKKEHIERDIVTFEKE